VGIGIGSDDMPLFICDCCGAVDNTALGGSRGLSGWKEYRDGKVPDLCCKCHTGVWHNEFPYEICDLKLFLEIGAINFVYWMEGLEPRPDAYQEIVSVPKTPHVPKDYSSKSKRQLKLLKRSGRKKRRS